MRLIGLSGRKRSGKDTVCGIIVEAMPHMRVQRIAFADALKEEVAAVLGLTVADIEADKARFRGMLQWWGTEWRRGQDRLYWIKQARQRIQQAQADVVVVTDVRFPSEAELIKELGGRVIRVSRPDADTAVDPHPSEVEVDSCPFEAVILNNSDLKSLSSKVEELVLRQLL